MNGQVEVTWRALRTIAHTLMVHDIFLEAYIHFLLIYTIDHIFPVLPIKDLIPVGKIFQKPAEVQEHKIYFIDVFQLTMSDMLQDQLLNPVQKVITMQYALQEWL